MQNFLNKQELVVPTADAATNVFAMDVVGNKTDAAATGAVSTVESLMAYSKQNVTNTEAAAAAITVIDAFHDVPAQNSANNSQMRDVIGNKTDTGAGNSLYSWMQRNSATGLGASVLKSANCTGATPIALFTVTGDVLVTIFGICKANLTTSDAITVEVGVAGNTAILLLQIVDATALLQNEIYLDATPTTTVEAFNIGSQFIISNGQDIILTTTGTVTAGTIDFYCFYRPLSNGAMVVAA